MHYLLVAAIAAAKALQGIRAPCAAIAAPISGAAPSVFRGLVMSEVSHKFTVSTKIANLCDAMASRFALAGVQVAPAYSKPGNAPAVSLRATDGRRLAATIEEGSATHDAIINGDALKLKGKEPIAAELNGALKVSAKPAKRGAPAVVSEYAGGEIDGRYPRVKDIFPNDISSYTTIELDYQFLSEIAAAIRPAGAECHAITLAIPTDANTPAIFQFGDNIGVIMPMERESGREGAAAAYRRALVRHGFAEPEAPAVEPAPAIESAPVVETPAPEAPPVAPVESAPVETAPLSEKRVDKGLSAIWRYNAEKHGIEIKFREAPRPSIRSMLKEAGFRWSARQELWYAPASDASRTFAEEIAFRHDSRAPQWTISPSAPVNLTPSAPVDEMPEGAVINKHAFCREVAKVLSKPAPAPRSENVDAFLAMIGG